MTKAKCLICNGYMEDSNAGYHASCCKELFGQPTAPDLPYAYSELNELAKKIVMSRITVPGVQAKLSLHFNSSLKGPGRFTLVGLWGNYILKPPMDAYPFMPEIENLTMCLANFFGIATVSHGLIRLKSGELAYITRRIDRLPDGRKLHMEDMCQLNERLTEDKYKGSMEQIGKIVKKYSSNPLFDCIRLFEVTLFSFLTGNADMHLKNFSLIYPVNGMVQLSPAYDLIASRLLISEKDDPEEMALTMNGKKRRIVSSDFKKFSENLGLNEIQFQNIRKKFAKKMHTIGSLLENTMLPDEKAHDFIALITERALRIGLM
ncbi:MAG: HipA domain-containing protein [Pseudomonadota bacterium]